MEKLVYKIIESIESEVSQWEVDNKFLIAFRNDLRNILLNKKMNDASNKI